MKTKVTALAFAFTLAALARSQALADVPSAPPTPSTDRTVVIVAGDNLKFSVPLILAAPGERIHVQLRNEGTMPKATMGHNWILLDSQAVAATYATTAMADRQDGYQPKALAGHVLASIPLLGPKEVGDVTFEAPAKPGRYPFICSCSGHSLAGMKGELVVK